MWAKVLQQKQQRRTSKKQNFVKDSIAIFYMIWPFSLLTGSPLIRALSAEWLPTLFEIVLFCYHCGTEGKKRKAFPPILSPVYVCYWSGVRDCYFIPSRSHSWTFGRKSVPNFTQTHRNSQQHNGQAGMLCGWFSTRAQIDWTETATLFYGPLLED